MAYIKILRQVYITADISQQIYSGRYVMAVMADILQHIYIYITADILRQIYYCRYIMADTLWPTYCVPKKRQYLDKFPAPEALDCCVRTCLVRPTAARTPPDRLSTYEKVAKIKKYHQAPGYRPIGGTSALAPMFPFM